MKKLVTLVAIAGLTMASAANAEFKFDQKNLYVGGGMSSNGLDISPEPDRAIGYQFFAGYDLGVELAPKLKSMIEVGYMNSGDWDGSVDLGFVTVDYTIDGAAGLWTTYVASYAVADQLSVLGRIGLDFGDDDGLMFGFGAGFAVTPAVSVRAEYVVRTDTDSMQVNATLKF